MMKIVESGNREGKTLLLVHAMLMDPELSFQKLNELLKEDYHILTLFLDGDRGEGTFSSITDQAKKATQLLKKQGFEKINGALGVSMGSNLLVEMLALSPDLFDKAVLDAPFLTHIPSWYCHVAGPGIARKIHKLIASRDKAKINALASKMNPFPDQKIDIAKDVDYALSYESIKNQGISSKTTNLSGYLRYVQSSVIVICGSEEKWALKSYRKLKHYLPKLELHTFEGHSHGTKLLLEVEDYKAFLDRYFNGDPL